MIPPQTKALSVEAVVDSAMRISEKEGYEAISMRRLADEFDVTAMALYGYVETKHHLLELVADRYMAELDLAEDEADWEKRLTRMFSSFYELLVARPVLAHVLTNQTVDAPAAYRMADIAIGLLRENGFDDETAVAFTKVLASYTVGFALSERPRVATKRDKQARMRRLRKATDYPNLSELAESYVTWPEGVFEEGLQQLIRAQAGDEA